MIGFTVTPMPYAVAVRLTLPGFAAGDIASDRMLTHARTEADRYFISLGVEGNILIERRGTEFVAACIPIAIDSARLTIVAGGVTWEEPATA